MRWCQLLLLGLFTAAPFAIIWFLFYRGFITRNGPNATVRMDPVKPAPSAETEEGGFESHLQRYSDLAKLLLTLAAATVAFLVNFLANISSEGKRSIYSVKLESACAPSIWFLGASAACSIIFMLSENYAYEAYCQSSNRDTYSPAWYAFNVALGFCGFGYFLVAYAVLAFKIFW